MHLLPLETSAAPSPGPDPAGAGGPQGLHWLLFPGWGEDQRYWARVARLLPTGTQAHFVQLPGYGDNRAPVPLSLYALAEALEDASAALPPGPLAYGGNCSGAALALLAARQLERPAARLLLVDCFAAMPPYFALLLRGALGRLCYLSAFANPLGRAVTNRVLSAKRKADTDIMAAFAYSSEWTNYRYLQLYGQLGSLEDQPRLELAGGRAPDFVYGQRSFSLVRKGLPRWQAHWPGLRVRELEGVGHLAVQEAPERIAEVMAQGNAATAG
ncbi:alpha/beta hydrolase [bacterium]|nr:alpha/beta hydrolase [bacterium]